MITRRNVLQSLLAAPVVALAANALPSAPAAAATREARIEAALPRMRRLFRGFEDAYLTYEPARINTVRKPITDAVWRAHLAGTGPRIGISPLCKDGRCRFSALDIDCGVANIPAIATMLGNRPWVRSKSKGLHAFSFYRTPVTDIEACSHEESNTRLLDAASCTVFPRQWEWAKPLKEIIRGRVLFGMILMPYHGLEGGPLSIEEFLHRGEAQRNWAA